MIWIILALLSLWVGAGVALLIWNSRRLSGSYRREVDKRVYMVGEDIAVSLKIASPPARTIASDRDIILAIDHSSSMGNGPGSPLRESIRATENLIDQLPDNIHAGIVTFNEEARLLCPITGDRQQLASALKAIGSGGGTKIDLAVDCCRKALREGRAGVKKAVILLSDGAGSQEASEAAAERLREEAPDASIICIGFGDNVNESLMRTVAGSSDQYLHIRETEDLYTVFNRVAALVTGSEMAAGRIEEQAWAPKPFRLVRTRGLYPTGVRSENPTSIIWSVPLIGHEAVDLNYHLVADCPGWHSVASPGSRAVWQMPSGGDLNYSGSEGPKILILPWWMRWLWPVFNPLFWILFGRWWPCHAAGSQVESTPDVKALPAPTFPSLLPAPHERSYELKLRPVIVIGLGEVGEWTVCRLKDRMRDRGVDPSNAEVAVVHVSHSSNRPSVTIGSTSIDPDERVELHQDLRPYLESLRRDGSPSTREWIPLREWLADMRPLTTSRTIADDRRKARLALLRKPNPVERKLRPSLSRIIQSDTGMIVVVGSAHDPECSGMIAEIAHICAEKKASVTAVFAPTIIGQEATTQTLALTQELERMILMSGRRIASDRHDPAVSARQLFDQIIVLEQQESDAKNASAPAAELIWDMLAYEGVSQKLAPLRRSNDEIMCYGAVVDGHALPAGSLWKWVRERTLANGINGRWLGLVSHQGKLALPRLDGEEIRNDVETFWTARNSTRPASFLIVNARSLLSQSNNGSASALVGLQDQLPVGNLYHEQASYIQRERWNFVNYLEEWCHNILQREQKKGAWGLQPLMAALIRIEADLKRVLSNINRNSGNANLANVASLASPLYMQYLNIISDLRGDLSSWIASFVGPQLELSVDSLPGELTPICYNIENERVASEAGLDLSRQNARELLEREFEGWQSNYGASILGQLNFFVRVEGNDPRLRIRLRLDDKKDIGSDGEAIDSIRETLDHYRNVVLSWPLDQMAVPESVSNPASRFRVGKHSGRIYPQVADAADERDPFTISAIELRKRSLRDALGVARPLQGEVPYAWPEEANAARIAAKIRNRLNLNPRPFSPLVIHLMRNTRTLFGFLSDLGQGMIRFEGNGCVLRRNGKEYEIGPTSDALRGLDAFQDVAQQVVSYETSLSGDLIDPPSTNWAAEPEEILRAVEAHPLAAAAVSSPDWQMWRDVIRGVALEHGGS